METMGIAVRATGHVHERLFEERGAWVVARRNEMKEMASIEGGFS